MGILDWIEEKARAKMRFSQIKILYQSIYAAEYLIEIGSHTDDCSIAECCAEILERARDFSQKMSDAGMLDTAASEVLFDDNRSLKKLYAALPVEARSAEGSAQAVDFAGRFKPAAGWKAFSDSDWQALIDRFKAL